MAKAVQEFIPIQEIRDGIVILKNGQYRSVLIASSINFDLKSADEQTAILSQYQSFLNSLDFPVQLFVQSRKLDIRPYINVLEKRANEQTNDLIRIQTTEYIEFVREVTRETNIMSKSFFIVVPFVPPLFGGEKKSGGLFSGLMGSSKKRSSASEQELERFEENRSQIEQRKSIVVQGLARIGIRTVSLGTEELVELFYKIFNPGDLNVPVMPGAK